MATTDRTLGSAAALLFVALGLSALTPTAAQAAGEVAVGGYLDSIPAGGGAPPLSAAEAPALSADLGRLTVTDSGRSATLTYFTPRLSGFELGLGYTPEALSLGQPTAPVGHVPGDARGGDGPLAVGGGLSLSALQLGMSPHASGGRVGDAAGLVTAGVGYGFGPISTNLTYGLAKPADNQELNLFALSADLSVVPGVAITGGLAYAEEEKSGDQTAAGVLGLRLNF